MKKLLVLLTTLCLSIPLSIFALQGGNMKLTSSAFQHEAEIPSLYTCDSTEVTPPLSWANVPQGTKSFVLIVDDPDAPVGNWDHWILFNIPASVTQLNENMEIIPDGTKVGQNSWGRNNYGGPCPPSGQHRYFFKLYALDTLLTLNDGATKKAIEAAMQNHILEKAVLMGKYARKR